MRIDAAQFGLDREGGQIVAAWCRQCWADYDHTAAYHSTEAATYGIGAGIAVTVRNRILRTHADAWPGGDGFIALTDLAPFTFAGAVILAREEGRPEPEPGEPFGWRR